MIARSHHRKYEASQTNETLANMALGCARWTSEILAITELVSCDAELGNTRRSDIVSEEEIE